MRARVQIDREATTTLLRAAIEDGPAHAEHIILIQADSYARLVVEACGQAAAIGYLECERDELLRMSMR